MIDSQVEEMLGPAFTALFRYSQERLFLFDEAFRLVAANEPALAQFCTNSWDSCCHRAFGSVFRVDAAIFLDRVREAARQNSPHLDQMAADFKDGATTACRVKSWLVQAGSRELIVVAVTQQTEDRESANLGGGDLRELAAQAEVSKVANGLIHNLGNLFNSINISTQTLVEVVRDSKIPELLKANRLFLRNLDNIGDYVTKDPAGRYLPEFYRSVGDFLKEDLEKLHTELADIAEKVAFIKEMISTQQDYAKSESVTRKLALNDVVDRALQIELPSMTKRGIRIEKKYQARFFVYGVKSKVLHVFLNLFKNAKEAMTSTDHEDSFLQIGIQSLPENKVEVTVRDNGAGIDEANLDKMFSYGFTTKPDGHGFGLYTSAEAMNQLGGSIAVSSEGIGHGACFRLIFPAFMPGRGSAR
ncbi:ATP-binding protein [Acanthopleuribacter pedis]|uniref:histidine kinase n=1 Tax=Acanthopleuribacter pedis TaxID=442870 RepID=A0A8J7U1I6_9BACT|nr:ATP-binding protein [Acanthopleuribacter pedis]MBO1317567.1 hypothetical protein [Acanthopleuribacter pedis]